MLNGSSRNDRINGKSSNDLINTGSGNDIVMAGKGDDTVHGGSSNDYIDGEKGNGLLLGGIGDDTICGGDGDDSLFGEDGDDTLYGGEGGDVLSLFGMHSRGIDLSDLDLSYDVSGDSWTIGYDAGCGTQSVTLTGEQVADAATWDTYRGLAATFDGAGFHGDNFIDGGGGANYRLECSEWSGIVFGGYDDRLSDEFGYDDFIYVGGGDDILVGSAGYDVFYFGRGGGHDYVIDGNGPDDFGYSNALALL